MAKFAKSPLEEEVEKQGMDEKLVGMVSLQEPLSWRVYVDGAANQKGSGVGLVLISPENISTIFPSIFWTIVIPTNRASYSVSLFVTKKPNLKDFLIMIFLGDITTSPTPDPV